MIIQICKDVRIRNEDGLNYSVERQVTIKASKNGKNAGKKDWRNVGYYSRLNDAFNSLLTRHIDLIVDSRSGKVSAKLFLKLNQARDAIVDAEERVLKALEGITDGKA